jgi:hypothetical protein
MEIYRQRNGPPSSCHRPRYLAQILAIGEPALDTNDNVRIRDLQKREGSVFYPKEQVYRILQKTVILHILKCRCSECKEYLVISKDEQDEILQASLNPTNPSIILLAMLMCLGKPYVIRWLSRRSDVHDRSPGLHSEVLSTEEWLKLLHCQVENKRLDKQGLDKRDCFLDNYTYVVTLFHPPVFQPGQWAVRHADNTRFPFLDDQWHRSGSFGEVRKFNIHKSYLDLEGTKHWNLSSGGVYT